MNKILTTVAIIGLLAIHPLYACEDDVPCDKCAKSSEYSWNPSNEYVTSKLQRFYSLDDQITKAFSANDYDSAKGLVSEYLELADIYRCNWNYGNAIHDAYRFLGLISVRNGEIDEAAAYLVKAGKSTGSPQLDSFGPELDLANELLKLGKTEEVLIYLKDIASFWDMNDGLINKWVEEIENGGKPEINRLSFHQGFWTLLIFWISALWPIIVTVVFLFALRNKTQKKWLFGIAGIVSGYIAMSAVNWASTSMLTGIVNKLAQSGSETMLMFSIYALMSAGYIVPVIVVFAVSRIFVNKNV